MVVDENLISNYISELGNGKSTGINQINNEMLKNSNSKNLSTTIALIFEIILNHGIVPKRFNTSLLKPLIKDIKKSTIEVSNLRPVAISDAISNMFEKLILHYIDVLYVNHFKQFGFKKASSCSHALFVLKAAINYAKLKNKRLYAVAIDASKAFDKVNRLYMWFKLIEISVHPAVIRAIMVCYNYSEIHISLNDELSSPFKSTVGVRQGGILSPRLFAIYMHDMLKNISKMKLGIRIVRMSIDVIGYADDILLVSNILVNLQKMLEVVEIYCNQHEIKVNGDKTVLLIFNKWCQRNKSELKADETQFKPKLQGYELEDTYNLKYLGVEITSDQSNSKHIETRCNKVIKALASIKAKGLCDKQIHPDTKAQMYKTYIMPILTYGIELLILNKRDITNKLREIFNMSSRGKIAALITSLTSTYTPTYLLT
jgi:hypothetical protein